MEVKHAFQLLTETFPDIEIKQDHILAPYTTLKIGGSADIFIHTKTDQQFLDILEFCFKNKFNDITILGNGSNVLVSDQGIRGIVIKNSAKNIEILNGKPAESVSQPIDAHRNENESSKYLDFSSLYYDETGNPPVLVGLSSGTPLPYAINYLIDQGITGLQWFAYIPGTIGGAVWYNIHGGTRHFSEYIKSVRVFDMKTGLCTTLDAASLFWDYDTSYFQSHPQLIIISTTLQLFYGDPLRAKTLVNNWIKQKTAIQSMNSAGSVFKNPSLSQCMPIWGEQKSAGWIIDHELNLKGKSIGQAQISSVHANIIVNNGNASASDFYTLANSVTKEVEAKFGLKLEMEIKLLGEF